MTKEIKETLPPSCSNCYYVQERQETPDNAVGMGVYQTISAYYCRRFPPQFEGIIRVSHDGWCGEWHEKQQ